MIAWKYLKQIHWKVLQLQHQMYLGGSIPIVDTREHSKSLCNSFALIPWRLVSSEVTENAFNDSATSEALLILYGVV